MVGFLQIRTKIAPWAGTGERRRAGGGKGRRGGGLAERRGGRKGRERKKEARGRRGIGERVQEDREKGMD